VPDEAGSCHCGARPRPTETLAAT